MVDTADFLSEVGGRRKMDISKHVDEIGNGPGSTRTHPHIRILHILPDVRGPADPERTSPINDQRLIRHSVKAAPDRLEDQMIIR